MADILTTKTVEESDVRLQLQQDRRVAILLAKRNHLLATIDGQCNLQSMLCTDSHHPKDSLCEPYRTVDAETQAEMRCEFP
jgi:hypothetical protein